MKTEQLYEGKAKKVYATEDPELVIVSYKDDATALDGLKKGTIVGNAGGKGKPLERPDSDVPRSVRAFLRENSGYRGHSIYG